jgi:murein DD-endopeptidase MepM/ murein hydrolase activator NlpD
VVFGYSVEGRPLTATRIGHGPIKVVLVGSIHGAYEANTYTLALELLDHYETHPEQVPEMVSLWIAPTMNPDGLATGHRWNARDVDLNRNADTDLDGCAGDDWSPDTVGYEGSYPGAGGAFPFSEPETQAVRDFVRDAWVVVFYHSAAEAIYLDSCQIHVPTARLGEILSASTGYPVPEEGWTGYPVTGDFGDYLAGEGVASVTLELVDHENSEFERNLPGVQAILEAAGEIVAAEADSVDAEYVWLNADTAGARTYAPDSFLHPIALEVLAENAYLLDGGRVLHLDLDEPAPPQVLLAPGHQVEGVQVLEPLDLAADGVSLLVLDRAGDVYRLQPATGAWSLERQDRASRDPYDHYFVALAAGDGGSYLLETSHEVVWRFAGSQVGAAWAELPTSRDVDLDAGSQAVYVLTRAMNNPRGSLLRFQDGIAATGFAPNVALMHPRQVAAGEEAVYLLDRSGRRLLALEPISGALLTLWQFEDRRAISAIWTDVAGRRLVLAGRDSLYFVGEPEQRAEIAAGSVVKGSQPHDIVLLEGLRGLSMPIEGATVTKRDFQMPGAPRHYRLGVHEGIDFYGHTVGVPVEAGTPVRAVADGLVVRALVDYEPLTPAVAAAWEAKTLSAGYTPADVLDGYRGRQVWIDHGGGLVSRYAHLSAIEPGIIEGIEVRRGEVIGRVGNSGTPGSLNSETYDAHLHLELWVGDHFVGQFLRPIEAREWLERIMR